ncbi:MAG TPA: dihydrofolate reductase family protein [Vicinamibacterales bacterium]|jgi:riboflavin biosynthesis pyrimidine reductase
MTDWQQRFEQVVRRKTHEALAADLPPFETVEIGAIHDLDAVGNEWTRKLFDGDFYLSKVPRDIPATGLVFVQSSDGNTGARNPSSLGGGKTDKHLIYEGLSRVAANGVLAGAETIRGTGVVFSVWRPELVELRAALGLPRHPIQIVATLGRLKFDDTLLFNVPELPVIVICTSVWVEQMRGALARRPWIRTIAMAESEDLSSAFRMLRSIGVARISAIGGRTIARAMIDAGVIQDLCLTTSPRPGGEPDTPLYPTPLDTKLVVRKRGTGAEAGVVFEHLLLKPTI